MTFVRIMQVVFEKMYLKLFIVHIGKISAKYMKNQLTGRDGYGIVFKRDKDLGLFFVRKFRSFPYI